MGNFRFFVFVLLVVFAASWIQGRTFAQEKSVEQRISDLERELSILKRQLEVRKEEADKKASETPVVTASAKDGFSIKAPDDSYKLKLSGYAQADGRFFTGNKRKTSDTDTFLIRTARLTFQGTVGKYYDFYLSPEFGSGGSGTSALSLPDAYFDVKYWNAWRFRFGKTKVPFGLERLQSTTATTFAELGLPSALAPNRDIGVQLYGDVFNERVNYAIGIFNGVEDGGTGTADSNNGKELAARVFALPFKNTDGALRGLGAGAAVTYGSKKSGTAANTIPTYKTAGQNTFFTYSAGYADGPQFRFSPQAYYYYKSLGLLGEYVVSGQKFSRASGSSLTRRRFENKAWQVQSSYVLTGEDASYKGVIPRQPLDFSKGTWGALEVAGRYGELDIDNSVFDSGFSSLSTYASRAQAWALGVNWYLNRNSKLVLDYERTFFEGGAAGNGDRDTESVIFSRFQLAF